MSEEHELLHELFEAADIGLAVVDRRLRVVMLNRVIVESEGGEQKGLHIDDAIPVLAPTLARVLRSVFETEQAVSGVEVRGEIRPGRTVHVVTSAWPLRREGQVVAAGMRFVDVTGRRARQLELLSAEAAQRQAADDALRENALRFRQLADNIGSAFWLATADRTQMLYVSPAFESVWGLPVDQIMASPSAFATVIHPDDLARVQARMATPLVDAWDIELRVVRPSGEVAWLGVRTFPVRDERGVIVRIAGIATDITKQRALEAQLLQAQKLDSLGRIAGGIAHDFNNLLTVVLNQVTMASRIAASGGAPLDELAVIEDAGRQAADVIRQLLTFAKRQSLVPAPLVLNDLVDNVTTFLRRIIGGEIVLTLALSPDLGVVRVDWAQLEQVLVNLTLNARDAMPSGGELVIRTENVVLETPLDGGLVPAGSWVLLSVRDTGRGIADADRPHIFEPFFSTKPGSEGTGLGLASCYGIIKQHGGHITVDSTLGAGTTFTLYFPRIDS